MDDLIALSGQQAQARVMITLYISLDYLNEIKGIR
jgi:hypothetical protein